MRLFLCRHGNTFNLGDETVWTGSTNDLPLVEKGEQQAHDVARWLREQGVEIKLNPAVIYASHLKRVKRFADIIKQDNEYAAPIYHDERLNEIDYGSWTGISDAAVIDQFGSKHIEQWRQSSVFPPEGQWGETEEQVVTRIKEFVAELKKTYAGKDILLVSSNGILRYFLKAFDDALFEKHVTNHDFQVKTGRMCYITEHNNNAHVVFWNKDPNS